MSTQRMILTSILLLTLATMTLPESQEASINLSTLVAECVANAKGFNKKLIESYTFTKKEASFSLDSRGRIVNTSTKVTEVYPKTGAFGQKLVSKDDKPLSKNSEEKEEKRVAQELEDAALHDLQRTPDEPGRYNVRYSFAGKFRCSILDFLTFSDLSLSSRDLLEGRDTAVLNFRIRPDFHTNVLELAPIANLQGRIWIDIADKLPMRVEARLTPSAISGISSKKKANQNDPFVIMEYTRLPDKMWVIRSIEVNTTRFPALFNGLKAFLKFDYSDYRRFNTDVKETAHEKPKA